MKLLTTAEAALIIRVTPRRVRQLINEGRLKAEQYGRDYLIHPSSLKRIAPAARRPGRPRKEAA